MTVICEGLSVIGYPIREEARVVNPLANLPEFFNELVTTLETSIDCMDK